MEKVFQLKMARLVVWSMTMLLALGVLMVALPPTTWPPVGLDQEGLAQASAVATAMADWPGANKRAAGRAAGLGAG